MPVPISSDLVVVIVKPLMPINSDTISISFSHEPSRDTSTFSRLVYPTGSMLYISTDHFFFLLIPSLVKKSCSLRLRVGDADFSMSDFIDVHVVVKIV
ncbi:hypothetical protein NC651_007617 [Populus alba x Populus x berolinensis]|nr:hypothetical protein NC651_007617 [Populus alba x Populus x berolinensis]